MTLAHNSRSPSQTLHGNTVRTLSPSSGEKHCMFSALTTLPLPEDMFQSCLTRKEQGMSSLWKHHGGCSVKDEHLFNQWTDYRAEDKEREEAIVDMKY